MAQVKNEEEKKKENVKKVSKKTTETKKTTTKKTTSRTSDNEATKKQTTAKKTTTAAKKTATGKKTKSEALKNEELNNINKELKNASNLENIKVKKTGTKTAGAKVSGEKLSEKTTRNSKTKTAKSPKTNKSKGKVRKWYEILKKGTETIVDRIFITGVAPITLDSLTSGFNIGTDITQEEEFNEMMGFTNEELKKLMNDQKISKEEQEKIMPIMKENYDGYKFCLKAKNQIYNSNMCLYFLSRYIRLREIPNDLVDVNIASDYSKVGKMLNLCKGENRLEILKKTVQGEPIINTIVKKFNPAIEFTENDMISMLYYLGYLTISGELVGIPELTIPNKVMKEIYADYFMQIMDKEAEFRIDSRANQEILIQLAQEGRIDKIVEILKIYLNNLSNRDLIKFDEKYIKLIFYCIAMNIKAYSTKSEMEVNRNYPDILLVPRDSSKGYKAVMVEFKYLKKGETGKLEEKQKEAREQIERYSSFDDIKDIQGLRKYTIVVASNDIYVQEI